MSVPSPVKPVAPPFPFTMAFQPIVDVAARTVWAHEALARGPNGEGAASVLAQVTGDNRFAFDQTCRIKAIELAARLFPQESPPRLSINFLPRAVIHPTQCIQVTLQTAERLGFPVDRIILEVTEGERFDNLGHVQSVIDALRSRRLTTAIDDFGAGYSGLKLMADLRPDVIKLDPGLIRGIDADHGRRAIVEGIAGTAARLNVVVVAEGVEREGEMTTLAALGVHIMQGFLFARPAFEALPAVTWPDLGRAKAGRLLN